MSQEPDLTDIQGNILLGYRAVEVHHLLLEFTDPSLGSAFLRELLHPNDPTHLRVTDAVILPQPPRYCLNLSFTFAGLRFLGVTERELDEFPTAYRKGAGARAERVRDDGPNAPGYWLFGGDDRPIHIIASLSMKGDATEIANRRRELDALVRRFALREVIAVPIARSLPGDLVHFGFREGIGQPHIACTNIPQNHPSHQPHSRPGEFLLGKGYVNQFGDNFLHGISPKIGDNATYGVFRLIYQDAWGFEEFLHDVGKSLNRTPDWVAAKLMGRWRNGASLTSHPTRPPKPIKESALDYFDYVSPPDSQDDRDGFRCPIGAHMRRLNPRHSRVAGNPQLRRIIRRAVPYGKEFPPESFDPDVRDSQPRGLIGYFFCGDIQEQFEFVMRLWASGDLFADGVTGTLDPIIGAQPPHGGTFYIPLEDGRRIVLRNIPRFIRTLGSLYAFLPGIGGLRHLSVLAASPS